MELGVLACRDNSVEYTLPGGRDTSRLLSRLQKHGDCTRVMDRGRADREGLQHRMRSTPDSSTTAFVSATSAIDADAEHGFTVDAIPSCSWFARKVLARLCLVSSLTRVSPALRFVSQL